jgi:hypothetical protein
MADREALAQPFHERIKIHAAIERAKGRGASVWTVTTPADDMTLRTHSFRQSAAALFQRTGATVFGEARRCGEQQKEDCEPHYHFPSPMSGEKIAFSLRHSH